jgi:hypothetical protein
LSKRIAVAIDFDGTLVEDKFPDIGKANLFALDFCRWCNDNNVALILWTCRTGFDLAEAIYWAKFFEIRFDEVNQNLPDWIESFKAYRPGVPADCRKVAADIYIDDKANGGDIDWQKIKAQLNILMKGNPLYNGFPTML